MSTAQDRLDAIYKSYSEAKARRNDDWAAAQTADQADAISRNIEGLENLYLDAANDALDANGPAVEAAYQAAANARKAVNKAYSNAKGIAQKISLVGDLLASLGDLVKEAQAATA